MRSLTQPASAEYKSRAELHHFEDKVENVSVGVCVHAERAPLNSSPYSEAAFIKKKKTQRWIKNTD